MDRPGGLSYPKKRPSARGGRPWECEVDSLEGQLQSHLHGAGRVLLRSADNSETGAGRVAARPEFASKTVVTFFYDTGERYLSIERLYPDGDIQTVR